LQDFGKHNDKLPRRRADKVSARLKKQPPRNATGDKTGKTVKAVAFEYCFILPFFKKCVKRLRQMADNNGKCRVRGKNFCKIGDIC